MWTKVLVSIVSSARKLKGLELRKDLNCICNVKFTYSISGGMVDIELLHYPVFLLKEKHYFN